MTLQELTKIVKFLRKAGVAEYESDGVRLVFGPPRLRANRGSEGKIEVSDVPEDLVFAHTEGFRG